MFRVKADNPDVAVSVNITGGADSEGNPIDASGFTAGPVVSDNDAAVSLVDNGDGTQSAHFGSPGVANLTSQISNVDGTPLATIGAQVEVTVGDPVSVSGGIALAGLTEDQPSEPTA